MNVRITGKDKDSADDMLNAIIKKLSTDESTQSEKEDEGRSPEPL